MAFNNTFEITTCVQGVLYIDIVGTFGTQEEAEFLFAHTQAEVMQNIVCVESENKDCEHSPCTPPLHQESFYVSVHLNYLQKFYNILSIDYCYSTPKTIRCYAKTKNRLCPHAYNIKVKERKQWVSHTKRKCSSVGS